MGFSRVTAIAALVFVIAATVAVSNAQAASSDPELSPDEQLAQDRAQAEADKAKSEEDKAKADTERAATDADRASIEGQQSNGPDAVAMASGEDDDVKKAAAAKDDADAKDAADAKDSDEAEESDEDDDDEACFPEDATVELEDGSVIKMSEVAVGDMVKVGVHEFSPVFMFTHKNADAVENFVALTTTSGAKLSLTSGHYLFVNGALAAAKAVIPGDELTLGNGDLASVASVATVKGTGLYNPQTLSGNVVVNGVLSSTYTTAVEPTFAHAILAPFRALQAFGLTFTALESGGGVLANVAPRGVATY